MSDTDKPTGRTPEPSHTVRAIRASVLHAIRERDQAMAQVETLAALVREVMDWHSDPDNGGSYNECETAPCKWCENAAAAIKGIDTGGQARIVRG